MTLFEKQKRFPLLVAKLIVKADELGYQVTFGEAWRPPEVAAIYAKEGRGISNSLHWDRLAIDLNLFKGGKWLRHTEDHRPLGEYWETLGEGCTWGGRFGDGNHYAITHQGRK